METIKFSVAGDIAPGGKLVNNKQIDPLQYLNPVLMDCDFLWTNLECPIPFENSPIHNKSTILSGDLDLLMNVIGRRKVVLSMANNHAMDYGLVSLLETKEILAQNNVEVFGVGAYQNEARRPLIYEKNGIRVGLVAFSSDAKWVGDHLKGEASNYISILNESSIKEVEKLSREVDHLLVALHLGKEFTTYPFPNDIKISKSFIDGGASGVFCHHAHVIQGYEAYKGKPIFYGLGNLLFPDYDYPTKLKWTKKERTGLIVKILLTKNDIISWRLVPTYFNNKSLVVEKLEGKDKHKIMLKIYRLSNALKIKEKKYQRKYKRHVKYTAVKLIFRGVVRNIFRPEKKHLILFYKLFKESLFGLPAEKSPAKEIKKSPSLNLNK